MRAHILPYFRQKIKLFLPNIVGSLQMRVHKNRTLLWWQSAACISKSNKVLLENHLEVYHHGAVCGDEYRVAVDSGDFRVLQHKLLYLGKRIG